MAEAMRHEGALSSLFAGPAGQVIDGQHLAVPRRPAEPHLEVGVEAGGREEDASRQVMNPEWAGGRGRR